MHCQESAAHQPGRRQSAIHSAAVVLAFNSALHLKIKNSLGVYIQGTSENWREKK